MFKSKVIKNETKIIDSSIKDVFIIVSFVIFIFSMFIMSIVTKDKEISLSERRKLNQFPILNSETFMNGKFMKNFEKYVLDQFPGREDFRKIKSFTSYYAFMKKDNNKIYLADGHISKYNNEINKKEVELFAISINKIYKDFFNNANVYYSIIPDKNYFLANKNNYPSIDYDEMLKLINTKVDDQIDYIDIFSNLEIDDYYKTDIHWKQDKIKKITNKLYVEMTKNEYAKNDIKNNTDKSKFNYIINTLEPFYGVYYKQASLPIGGEKLIYLTNETLDNVKVNILNEDTLEYEEGLLYDIDKIDEVDGYDLFLEGPKAIIILDNNNALTNKKLIIFRDSFTSSLAPLLSEYYSSITLIDLRYISTSLINDLKLINTMQLYNNDGNNIINMNNIDVLFMFSVDVINNSSILKVNH